MVYLDKRPFCSVNGCKNLAKYKRTTKKGERRYSKLCSTHNNHKYGYTHPRKGNSLERRKKKLKESLGVSCQICGWKKAPCDLHRIIPGKDGGKYTTDNIMVLCPNCHREKHLESHLLT